MISKELNETVEEWWTEEMYNHLPPYTRTNLTCCRKGPGGCYNNSRCPCTQATVFQMVGNATDHQGVPLPQPRVISGYYGSWPVFPAEHLDADSLGPDGVDAAATAGEMFATAPNSLGVLDWPHGVRMSAGRKAAGPYDPLEPGAQPVPLVQALTDWFTWTTTSPRPWTPWHADQARGNLFPFVTLGSAGTEVYAGGLEEIGMSMAINDLLLLVTGWPRQDPVIRLFPVWRHALGAGPASFSGLRAKVRTLELPLYWSYVVL